MSNKRTDPEKSNYNDVKEKKKGTFENGIIVTKKPKLNGYLFSDISQCFTRYIELFIFITV